MRNMLARAVRAARLDKRVFREMGDEPHAILHALGTVVLVGIAFGLGLMDVVFEGTEDPTDVRGLLDRVLGVWLSVVTIMVGWILWAALTYSLGTVFLGGAAGYRQIVRVLGISYGPAVLTVLLPLSTVGGIAYGVGLLWVLVIGVVAVHEMQEADWLGAILSALPGWFLGFVVLPVGVLGRLLSGS